MSIHTLMRTKSYKGPVPLSIDKSVISARRDRSAKRPAALDEGIPSRCIRTPGRRFTRPHLTQIRKGGPPTTIAGHRHGPSFVDGIAMGVDYAACFDPDAVLPHPRSRSNGRDGPGYNRCSASASSRPRPRLISMLLSAVNDRRPPTGTRWKGVRDSKGSGRFFIG